MAAGRLALAAVTPEEAVAAAEAAAAGGAPCPFESCARFSDSACAGRHCKRAGHLQPSGRDRYALIDGDDQCPSTAQARLS